MSISEFYREHAMTNCPTEDILLDYTAGQLGPEQSAQFERHADGCARCSQLRSAQATIWLALDEWKPAPVSEGFNRELWRKIDADANSGFSRLRSGLRFNLWKQVAPLGVATAVIITAFVFDHNVKQSAPVPAGSAIVVTVSDADQLERTLDDIQLLREVDAVQTGAKPQTEIM